MRLLRAELLKIFTTKMIWGMLALTLGFVALGVGFTAAFAGVETNGQGLPPLTDPDMVRAVYGAATGGILFVMILGIIGITGEYRHQTITQAFLTTPRRGRLIVAKLIAYTLVGAVFGVAAILLTVAVAVPFIAAKDGPLSLLDNGIPIILAGTVLASALYALVGLGLGSLIRNQIAAIVLAVGWVQLVEAILVFTLPVVGKWLPGGAVQAIVQANVGFGGVEAPDLLPTWGGALVLLCYGVIFAVTAGFTTVRRDIT